jgi:RNA polymerase primary sigma factor
MAKQTNTGLQFYLKQIREIPLLTAEEECKLAEMAQAGNENARNKLVASNLRLVIMAVKHYAQNTTLSFEDLIQEGNLGLLRATKDFNPTLGWRFSTYAMYWIKQSISRAILNHSKTIRLPVHISELKAKYNKAQMTLQDKLHRVPSVEEIAAYLNVEIKKIKEIENLIKEPVSLNASLNDEDDGTVEDLVADQNVVNPETILDNEFLASAINEVLPTLDKKEQEVIIARYGLNKTKPKTLEQLGEEFGVTKERIRQIEQKALVKLRNPRRASVLKPHLD